MPDLTITIPTEFVPELTAAADELLLSRNLPITGTLQVKGRRYIGEILKDVVRSRRRVAAQTAAQAAIDAAANTNVDGIV